MGSCLENIGDTQVSGFGVRCPSGRMASAQVLLRVTPFCRRDKMFGRFSIIRLPPKYWGELALRKEPLLMPEPDQFSETFFADGVVVQKIEARVRIPR